MVLASSANVESSANVLNWFDIVILFSGYSLLHNLIFMFTPFILILRCPHFSAAFLIIRNKKPLFELAAATQSQQEAEAKVVRAAVASSAQCSSLYCYRVMVCRPCASEWYWAKQWISQGNQCIYISILIIWLNLYLFTWCCVCVWYWMNWSIHYTASGHIAS